jgi:uncharacterized DUF497 family protein
LRLELIIKEIIWFESVVEKLQRKHSVSQNDVEEVFETNPKIFFIEEGNFQGEDVYAAMGRTNAGRYLIIFFIYKKNRDAIILSARQMTFKEKKRYGKK